MEYQVSPTQKINTDYRQLFELAPIYVIALSADLTIVAVSDAYAAEAKMSREQMLGRKFFEVFAENLETPNANGRSALLASFEKVLLTRESDKMAPLKYDLPRPEAEGGGVITRYWGAVNKPLLGPSGEVAYIVRRVDDITFLMNQEGEMRAIEQERDIFFDHAYDLMAIVGTDGYFKRVNRSVEKALGYSAAELMAKPLFDFLHPEDVEKTKRRIEILASGTPTIASENRYFCKDGTIKWFSWNTTPIGRLLYTVGRDITEQVKADEKIKSELLGREAQVLQLQKMDAVGRLAGGIAHDFNNMIGAIKISCDFLVEEINNPDLVRAKIKDIREVTTRAAALTRQLLSFSRKQIVQPVNLNLNLLIQQIEKMLVRLIGENIKIVNNLAADLQPICMDPSQVEQVILNLVVNAKDAMPNGGTITIETNNVFLDEAFTNAHLSVVPGQYVQLSVTDCGLGMDESTMAKIFEPFFTTKPVGKGTGLGLSTLYGIIKQNKGTVWVYSEQGKGSTFKVYLPATKELTQSLLVKTEKRKDTSCNQTILLVEDDETLREAFAEALSREGYRVLVASDGEQALNLFEDYREPIDLLLTDMVMPGLNGYELAQRIVKRFAGLGVIYMSGYTSDILENTKIENLARLDFLQKPFGMAALIEKVQEVLAKN